MSELEQQTEEIEALISIYEGDTSFKQVNSSTFQCKYGDEDTPKSFIIEITWGLNYPNELPKISMDSYYNRNISQPFRTKVIEILTNEGENWIGCGMTYTLFECIKEQLTELLDELEVELKNAAVNVAAEDIKKIHIAPVINTGADTQPGVKKEQLTKSQKRRMWERTDNKGQKPRGWDWVDIIRHLSQSGYKDDVSQSTQLAPPPNN